MVDVSVLFVNLCSCSFIISLISPFFLLRNVSQEEFYFDMHLFLVLSTQSEHAISDNFLSITKATLGIGVLACGDIML